MGKLNQIDKKAESKGSGVVTLWQFIKFIFVSLGACIVQFGLVNLLPLVFRSLYDTPCDFFVFHYPVSDGGLGYFLSFAISNIAAQIVAFFINKEKTFNSGANTKVVLPIYVVSPNGSIPRYTVGFSMRLAGRRQPQGILRRPFAPRCSSSCISRWIKFFFIKRRKRT